MLIDDLTNATASPVSGDKSDIDMATEALNVLPMASADVPATS